MIYKIRKICCIGAGYVGGPTMAVIADKCPQIDITVVDINKERIEAWNDSDLSKLPIYEPGLDEIIKRCRNRNLEFSTNIKESIAKADMIFISVNTPTKKKGFGAGQAVDLKWVEASARQVGEYARGKTIIVEKSTLPVRTAETIKNILQSVNKNNKSSKYFSVLSNPEFLSEGTAIKDLENPDRVLIGGEDIEAIEALEEIYLNWIDKSKVLRTNLWSSELSKLTANAFLAQRISSINAMSALCEATGANVNEVAEAIGLDKRIGKNFLKAGPGFGGSCFKKDIMNLIYICNLYGLHEVSNYWQKVVDINNWQQHRISSKIIRSLFGTVNEKKLGIYGFSFKANTNDTRESPAIQICTDLLEEGANLHIYDPKVTSIQIQNELKIKHSENLDYCGKWTYEKNYIDAAKDADAIVIITEWDEFKRFNWHEISNIMRSPSWIFDTRCILDPKDLEKLSTNLWQLGTSNKD